MRKAIFLVLVSSILLFGCVNLGGGFDPVIAAKASGQVQQFLQEHPNAKIVAVLLTEPQVREKLAAYPDCASIKAEALYFVSFQDQSTKAVAFVSESQKTALCVIVEGTGTSATPNVPTSGPSPSSKTPEPSVIAEKQADVEGETLVEFREESKGYRVLKPASWNAQIMDDSYLLVKENSNTDALVWPIKLSGQYSQMTGVGLGNYLIGLIKQKFADFKTESIQVAPDKSKMEVVASVTDPEDGKTPLKVVMTTFVDVNGNGLLAGYEAPSAVFDQKEPVLRKIVASYAPIVTAQTKAAAGPAPTIGATAGGAIQLVPYSASDGSYSVNIPSGWNVETLGSCSTRSMAAYDPANPTRRIFAIASNNYVIPVQQGTAEEVAVSGLPVIQKYVAAYTAPTNIQLGAKEPYPATQGVPNIVDAGVFDATMTLDGKPAKGRVGTYLLGGSGVYELSLAGIIADASDFNAVRDVMDQSIKSFLISQSYANQCSASSQADISRRTGDISRTLSETSDIVTSGYNERSRVQDRVAEKWSDTTLGYDRVYNPDSDQVYRVPNGFYDKYDINRQAFEQQNLQQLTPNQWNDYAPLDGAQNIR